MRVHLPLLNNLVAIEVAKRHGMSVELNFDTRKLGTSKEEVLAVRDAGRGIAKSVHGPFMDLNPGALDQGVRELTLDRLGWAIETATLLEVDDLIIHDGYIPLIYGYPSLKGGWLQRASELLVEISKMGRDRGVRVLLENMFTDDPLMIKALAEEAGLNVCLDVGHIPFSSNIAVEEWVNVLHPLIKEVHVHDNDGASDEHLALGAGTIKFDPVISLIPMFTLELGSEADLEASIDYMRERGWI